MVRDLGCEWVAPDVDANVVAWLRERYSLSQEFFDQMAACQGGVPRLGEFPVGSESARVARFLTLTHFRSNVRPDGWQSNPEDFTIEIDYLVDGEHQTMLALFNALVPFASLRDGLKSDLTHTEVDLLCLDCRDGRAEPPVVLWRANKAFDELVAWEQLPIEQSFDATGNHCLNVKWDTFLEPVAASFGEFIESLRNVTAG